jgi:hypothetical protein
MSLRRLSSRPPPISVFSFPLFPPHPVVPVAMIRIAVSLENSARKLRSVEQMVVATAARPEKGFSMAR